jgi:putative ATP-binding cassette transporter
MPSPAHSLVSRLLKVGLPFFRSGSRAAYAWLATLILLLLANNGLNVVNSYVGRDFMTAIEARRVPGFYEYAAALAGVFAALTLTQVLSTYAQQRFGLLWREWLTRRLLARYLAGRAYRRLANVPEVDNPDQRISEDVRTFTDSSLAFLVMLFNTTVTLVAFAGVLWSIRPVLFLAAVGYAALGSLGTVLIGRRLVQLSNLQLKKEADFRFGLGRVRENARAVAQLGGEPTESARLRGWLQALLDNYRVIIAVSRNLGFFTVMYGYLPQIIPVLLAAPLYVRGEIQFGEVTQSAMAFSQVQGAFSLIVTQFQALSTYAAVAGRLGALWEATGLELEARDKAAAPKLVPVPAAPAETAATPAAAEAGPDRVSYEKLTLRADRDGRPLVRELTLDIRQGKRVLVTGPSGSGKTALLLATAGLWRSGEGRVICPEGSDILFLPKHPYTARGRLRDLLCYGSALDLPDERLWAGLGEVGLDRLVERAGGLDAERDWPEELSRGEQQLAAFARLLAVRPKFAFLDDPAGTLDAGGVKRVYEALARSPITYVSVGGHVDLRRYHDLLLELHGDGSWHAGPIDQPSAA